MLYHDLSHNILLYKTDTPARILTHVMQARAINGSMVAVPVNLHNLQMCRRLDLPVIPIMRDYDWPCAPGLTPLHHQKLMSNFMVLHPYSFNLSDMGTMKTLATLWACDWLMRQHPAGTCRALIVAPLSILERTWADAIFTNFLGNRTFRILHGSAEKRRSLLAEPADFYIVNYDGLGVGAHTRRRFELDGFSADVARRADIQICVVDEASAYRDARTRRHRVARLLCKRNYLWLLTGTPCPNAPTDAFGLSKLVNDAFGESFTAFHNRTMTRLTQFKWVPKRDGYVQARRLLTPSIRFDIKDVWDGPPLTTQQRHIDLTTKQRQLIDEITHALTVTLDQGHTITPANEASVRTKLLQIIMGAVYDNNHIAHDTDAKSRLRELDSVIENANGKIIVLAPFTSVVHLIYKHVRHSKALVYGGTPAKDRSAIFKAFQEDEAPRILVADPGCLAHGLDLWRAQTVVWYGPTDKTELYMQANKRAHRPGQTYPVTVVQLTSTKLEREIFARLGRNERLQGLLLDMVKRGIE